MQATAVPFQRTLTNVGYRYTLSRSIESEWDSWRDPDNRMHAGLVRTVSVTTAFGSADFYVVYKDVHVVEMPVSSGRGGFLMLAGRYRVRTQDAESAAVALDQHCLPGRSIGDIVAFWSLDRSFTKIVGPIPLVTSSTGVTDPEGSTAGPITTAGFRSWLGVPAGVFYGDDLYLYYSARPDLDDTPVNAKLGASYAPYLDTDHRLEAAIEAFDDGIFGTTTQLNSLTYVARLSLTTLTALLDAPPPEEDWDIRLTWPALDLARPVRLWHAVMTSELPGLRAVRLEEMIAPDGPTPWCVDAVPSMCVANLSLFVSVQPHPSISESVSLGADTRYGIWVGRGLPAGQALPTGGTSLYGVDFLCGWEDLVVQSWSDGTNNYIYKDPDPVLLLSGWRVYTGDVTSTSAGSLDYVDGSLDCLPWTAAWELPAAAALDLGPFAAIAGESEQRLARAYGVLSALTRPIPAVLLR